MQPRGISTDGVICGGVGISDAYYCKECTQQENIETGAQRLSIWGVPRLICSTRGTYTDLRNDDPKVKIAAYL
ncbi:hypothetical protein Leryth_027640 [Lithospermum erythrorhizon]|nr:hypothetical protein Leryth_027640 [Lithospermum erythrorhizon]